MDFKDDILETITRQNDVMLATICSLDGKRLYVTNSLFTAWDKQ